MTLPKFINDLEAHELIYGPPDEIWTEEKFRVYQTWMSDLLVKQDAFLAAEMGLGKTAAVLRAIRKLIDAGVIRQVLISAPLRVAEETWPAEIAKWSFARGLTYRIVTGTEEERKAALAEPAQLTIINRENIKWLKEYLGVRRWNFDMLVYDEVTRLKSGRKRVKPNKRQDGTKGFKNLTELGVLRQMRFKFNRIVELSGTPSPKGLIDLWGPIYLIDQGYRLGQSITAYKDRWFKENKWTRQIEPHDHSQAEIMARIKDVFFSLREEDYLSLPPLIPVQHKVTLTPQEMAKYKQFEKDMAMKVVNRWGEPEIIKAVNDGVLTNKLLQFANGSMYLTDHSAVKIHDHKLDVLESIVTEAAGNPMLIAYSFQFDRDAIKKRFPRVRIFGESRDDMRDWNAGKIEMMLTHPASAGHGLNFQLGSNIAVWYGLTWSLELYLQFLKRLHRSGQKADKVWLHHILTRGTVDENILPVLQRRGATQDDITDAVRVRLFDRAGQDPLI